MQGKPIRAFLLEFSWEIWPLVFAETVKRGILEPIYWSGTATYQDQVRTMFPSCIYQDSMSVSRGEAPIGPRRPVPRWTAAMTQVWREDAQDILAMLTRADLEGGFDLQSRLEFIQDQLALWDSALERLKPDLALFSAPPHVGYDYIFYRLCRARKIPTLIFEWCLYGPHTFFWESLEDGDATFRKRYQERLKTISKQPPQLSEAGAKYLGDLRGRNAAATHYPDLNRQVFGPDPYQDKAPKKELDFAAELKNARKRFKEFLTTQYLVLDDYRRWQANRPAVAWESAFIVEKNIKFREAVKDPFVRSRLHGKYRKWLATAYERQARYTEQVKPIPDGPFIFLGLHQQPERTTSPQGGMYVDQLKIIQLISSALPPGWKLVVKEHLAQLNPDAMGHMYRSPEFYKEAAALPNVVLVSQFLPPSLLIDKCQIGATVSGTIGWETVVRGKPVFIFGDAWYRDCEGVFRIRDFESFQAAFAAVQNGQKVDPQKVDAFLETIEKNQVQALPQPPLVPYCTLSVEENASRLVGALATQLSVTARP